jgi:hypothetical protein
MSPLNGYPNDALAELEISIKWLKKCGYQGQAQYFEIYLSYLKSCMDGANKALSHERGWAKSAYNLSASPFKIDLLIDTTFSQIHLAEQSV